MKTISCMNIDESLLYSFGAEDRHHKILCKTKVTMMKTVITAFI